MLCISAPAISSSGGRPTSQQELKRPCAFSIVITFRAICLPQRWLIAEWPDTEPEPVTYWLSSQPTETEPAKLIRAAKIRWRIEHDYRELKTGLGLDHFEGRSFTGWHRHVTLVTAAHLFITTLRLDPKAAAPA